MSYRFKKYEDGDKELKFRFPSGDEIYLGIEDGDTVLDLKKYIWREKLGDLRVGYGRMHVVYMKDIQDSEHVILDNDFRLDQDDITRKNGDKEKISKGVLSIVSSELDLDKIHELTEEYDLTESRTTYDLSCEDLSMINLKN